MHPNFWISKQALLMHVNRVKRSHVNCLRRKLDQTRQTGLQIPWRKNARECKPLICKLLITSSIRSMLYLRCLGSKFRTSLQWIQVKGVIYICTDHEMILEMEISCAPIQELLCWWPFSDSNIPCFSSIGHMCSLKCFKIAWNVHYIYS